MTPAYRYKATLVRAVDADTLELCIDLGFHVSVTVPVRVRGVDAPELRTLEGKAAKAWVEAFLAGKPIVVATYKDQQSFARWVADVYAADDLLSVALTAAGYVK